MGRPSRARAPAARLASSPPRAPPPGERRGAGREDALLGQLLDLARAQNKATDGGTSIPATFLRVTVSL